MEMQEKEKKNLRNEFIRTFRKSCRTDRVDIGKVKALLDRGEDINTRDDNGYTPLYYACVDKDRVWLKFVLEHGADINLTYNDKYCKENILHVLARRSSLMLDIVCEYDVSKIINERDGKGLTPLDIVERDTFCGDDTRKALRDILKGKGGKESKDISIDISHKNGDKVLLDYTYSENMESAKAREISK